MYCTVFDKGTYLLVGKMEYIIIFSRVNFYENNGIYVYLN